MNIISVPGPSGKAYSIKIAGDTPTPEEQAKINAFLAQQAAPAPGTEPDTSFMGAIRSGIDMPLESMASTANVLGFDGTGNFLSNLTDAPENYQSATEGFINDDGSFYDFSYLPRAAVEQGAQFAGSMLARAGGAGIGALAGAPAGPGGAAIGATLGGWAAPAVFEAVQVIGPVAEERARNNGRDKPNQEDLNYAFATAAASGALNAIPVNLQGFLKKVLLEAGTEGLQALIQQAGGTGNTDAGLQLDPRAAGAEAILGGTSAGIILAPGAAAERRAATSKEEEEKEVLRNAQLAEDLDEDAAVAKTRLDYGIAAVEKEAQEQTVTPKADDAPTLSLPAPSRVPVAEKPLVDAAAPQAEQVTPPRRTFETEQYNAALDKLYSIGKFSIPAIQSAVAKTTNAKVPVSVARDIRDEMVGRGVLRADTKSKEGFVLEPKQEKPFTEAESLQKTMDDLQKTIEADRKQREAAMLEVRRLEQMGGTKQAIRKKNLEVDAIGERITTNEQVRLDTERRLVNADAAAKVPTTERPASLIKDGKAAVPLVDAPPEAQARGVADRTATMQTALANYASRIKEQSNVLRQMKAQAKKVQLPKSELEKITALEQSIASDKYAADALKSRIANPSADVQMAQEAAAANVALATAQQAARAAKTPIYTGQEQRVFNALTKRLKNLGLSDVRLTAEKLLRPDGAPKNALIEGMFNSEDGKAVIALSMSVYKPGMTDQQLFDAISGVMNHEVIHALRNLGLFTDAEWKTLSEVARRQKYMKVKGGKSVEREYTYFQRAQQMYGGSDVEIQIEEAVAEMFRDYVDGKLKIGGKPRSLMDRIKSFFKAIWQAHADADIDPNTIFEGVRFGEIGRRERKPQAAPDGARQSMIKTESAAFKKWFGDSKVVNPDGTPKVVYHGTPRAGFTRFETEPQNSKTRGTGAFFTDSAENASTYSGTRSEVNLPTKAKVMDRPTDYGFDINRIDDEVWITDPDGYENKVEDGQTPEQLMELVVDDWLSSNSFGPDRGNYAVYLSLQNPLVIDAEGANWAELGAEDVYRVKDAEGRPVEDFYTEEEALDFIAEDGGDLYVEKSRTQGFDTTDSLARQAREYGDYDGVIFENVYDSGSEGYGEHSSTVYVAFKPTQIKSTQNEGTFDPKNADIRYSMMGAVKRNTESENFKRWFGDSVVTDADGKPKMVVHATRFDDQISEFMPLTHFGTPQAGNDRLGGTRVWQDDWSNEHAYPVYLSIKKPLDIGVEQGFDRNGGWEDDIDMLRQIVRRFKPKAGSYPTKMEQEIAATLQDIIEFGDGRQNYANVMRAVRTRAATALQELGYDGISYTNMVEDKGSTSYVVFRPQQVKSAFNQGTFDANNPDIRYSAIAVEDTLTPDQRREVEETQREMVRFSVVNAKTIPDIADWMTLTPTPVKTKEGKPSYVYGAFPEGGRMHSIYLSRGNHTDLPNGTRAGFGMAHIVGGNHDKELFENSRYTSVEQAIFDLLKRWEQQGHQSGQWVTMRPYAGNITLEWRDGLTRNSPPLTLVLTREGPPGWTGNKHAAMWVKTFFPELPKAQQKTPKKYSMLKLGGVYDEGRVDALADDSRARAITRMQDSGDTPDRISTRQPKNLRATEDPLTENLIIDLASMKRNQVAFAHNMDVIKTYPGFVTQATDPDTVAEDFIRFVSDNLVWLYDRVPQDIRGRSKLWYNGARRITEVWSGQYQLPDFTIAGVLAALSPQKDWYQNVSLAERLIDIHTTFSSGNMLGYFPDQNMAATGRRIYGKPQYRNALTRVLQSPYSALVTDVDRAMWLRIYDEANNPRGFRKVSPDGHFIGEPEGNVAWGSNVEIAKAIFALRTQDRDATSAAMGEKHKVRNFYNNILAPNAPHGDVTIDTHAVAAALLRPLSGNSEEVHHNFGSSPEIRKRTASWRSVKNDGDTGASGTYGLYAEAYRRVADDLGILPRELQSITWEAVRGLFPAEGKRNRGLVGAVNREWAKVSSGEQVAAEARELILDIMGGVNDPTWHGLSDPAANRRGPSSYEGELAVDRVNRQWLGRGVDGGDAGGDSLTGGGSGTAGGGVREGSERYAGRDASLRQGRGRAARAVRYSAAPTRGGYDQKGDRSVERDARQGVAPRTKDGSPLVGGVTSEDLLNLTPDFFRKPGWAIITATDTKATEQTNNRAHQNLVREFERRGIPYREVYGVYEGTPDGTSYIALMDEGLAVHLGMAFNQDSILTNRGFIFARQPMPRTALTDRVYYGEEAEQQPFYSKPADGEAFSLAMDQGTGPTMSDIGPGHYLLPERPQLPVRASDGKVELHHWTGKKIATVDPKKAGSGPLNGEERRRGAELGFFGILPRENDRQVGTGYVKESGLGDNEYVALVDPMKLYPYFTDPDNLFDGLDRNDPDYQNEYEDRIKAAGYEGYYTERMEGTTPLGDITPFDAKLGNVAAMFRKTPVKPVKEVQLALRNQPRYSVISTEPRTTPRFAATSSMSPATRKQIGTAQSNLMYARSADLIATILHGRGYGLKKDSAQRFADNLLRKFQDSMLPVGRMVQELAQRGMTITDAMDPYLKEMLMHGVVGDRITTNENTLFKPMVETIKKLNIPQSEIDKLKKASDLAAPDGKGYVTYAMERSQSPRLALADAYLYAKHAKERNKFIREVRDPSNTAGSGMTDAEADAILFFFNSLTGENRNLIHAMALAARAIVADTNKTRLEAGLISQDVIDNNVFSFYVPLRGKPDVDPDLEREQSRPPSNPKLGAKGREDSRITGRYDAASEIVANLMNQNQNAILRGERNKVGQAFLQLMRADGTETYGKILDRRPMTKGVTSSGKNVEVVDMKRLNEPDMLTVKENGKETIVQLWDERLAIAMNGQNGMSTLNNLGAVKFMSKVNRYLASINTSYNPEFMITNAFRDLQTAGVNVNQFEQRAMTKEVVKNLGSALKGIKRSIRDGDDSSEWSKIYREFVAAGGQNSTNMFDTLADRMENIKGILGDVAEGGRVGNWNKVKRSFVGKGVGSLLDLLEDYNTVIENGVRVTTYKGLLDRGFSKERAAQAARTVTVNFAKSGEYRTLMNSMYLFYNASLQGSFALLNAAVRSPKVRRLWLGIMAAGVANDLLQSMLSEEDEDEELKYDKIPEHVLESNIILMDPFGLTDRSYFKIPMPYGLNMAYNAGRAMSRAGRQTYTPEEAGLSILRPMLDAFNPVGGSESFANMAAPTVLDPIVDMLENEDFANKPIYKEGLPFDRTPAPDSQLYWNSTSPSAVWIAKNLNELTGGNAVRSGFADFSPDVLEYWYSFLTGGVGRFVQSTGELPMNVANLGLSDDLAQTVPLTRKVFGAVSEREDMGSYIDRASEVLMAGEELKQAKEAGDAEWARETMAKYPNELKLLGKVKAFESSLRKLSKQKNDIIKNPRMAEEQKKVLLKKIEERRQQVLQMANRTLKDL